MKRALLLLVVVLVLAGFSGCAQQPVAANGGDPDVQPCACGRRAWCWPFRNVCCGPCRERAAAPAAMAPPQPPIEAITYPYYTIRGPRDFLERTPSPIGP